MKSVSRFALLVAAASLSIVAGSTASAQDAKAEKPKKEKPAKPEKPAAPLKLSNSKEFQAAYNPVVSAYLKKKDAANAAIAKESWPKIKAAIMNEDDRYSAGGLAQDLAAATNDKALRIEAMDLLIASGRTPESEKRTAYYLRGAIAFDSKDWPTALTNLQKSYDMGFRQNAIEGGTELLMADALGQQGKFVEAIEWMKKSEAGSKVAGAKPLPSNFDIKMLNFAQKTKDYKNIGPILQTLVRKNNTPAYWHDALNQTYVNVDLDSQEVLDLFRLLRTVNGMLYQQNYKAYATDGISALFPTEVKGLLEEGFAKKTITNTAGTFGPLYTEVQTKLRDDPFSLAQLDKDIASATTAYSAAASGDIALSVGEYARAKKAYEVALAKGPVTDLKDKKDLTERTVMRLGMAKVKLGDLAGARADFAKISSPTRRVIADYWVIYLDHLAKAAPAPAPAG
jgi:tetratricopeptide (TPR) repeat protein